MRQFGNIAIKTVLTVIAFLINLNIVDDEIINEVLNTGNRIVRILLKILYAIEDKGILSIALFVAVLGVYKYMLSVGRLRTEEKVIGVLMALTCLFGRAFNEFGTTAILITGVVQTLKTMIVLLGYILFFPCCIRMARDVIGRYYSKIEKIFSQGRDINDASRYRRIMWLVLLTVYGIYAIAYYPGIFMGDTEDIIYMAYNYHTVIADSVQLISEDVFLVDHHSVLYTLILGFFVKAGRALFASENIGLFIYTVLQAAFIAWVLAYSLYKLKIYNVSLGVRNIILLFFCLFPWIPKYAVMATKDTLFAGFLVLYLLLLMDIIEQKREKIQVNQMVRIVVYSVLIFLFRKNGLYVVVLSLPFLIMINKKWVKSVCIMIALIFVSKFVYSDVILPQAKIPDGSISAALSIPLQQTARYLNYYGDEVTEEEKAAIDAVADYHELATTYWADRSDWAKAAWHKEAESEDIKKYFVVWGKMLLKHPLTYVAATANNYYGYFYPVVMDLHEFEKSNIGGMASVNSEGYFNFKETDNKVSVLLRHIYTVFDSALMKLPVINIVCTSALYIWLLIFALVRSILKKDNKLLMLVIPMLMLMLTILAGPCNGNIYHRFTYPITMCIPLIIGYGVRMKEEG